MSARATALEVEVMRLAANLRLHGHGELAGPLRALVPPAALAGDDHLPALLHLLDGIGDMADVPAAMRIEARRLSAVGRDLPAAIGRTGTVFGGWNVPGRGVEHGSYGGYWDAAPDSEPAMLEEYVGTTDLENFLEWARRRADRVRVRPAWDPGTIYWAGVGPSPYDDPVLGSE